MNKPQDFEDYLREIHALGYMGSDDDMPDAFNQWLEDLEPADWLGYGQTYGISRALRAMDRAKEILHEIYKKY